MNEFYPIPTQYVRSNQSDVIRNVRQYLKNPIGATLTLLTPPSAFEAAKTRINGNDLQWTLGNITSDTTLILQATWKAAGASGSTETALTIIRFKVLTDTDFLEWMPIPPVDMFSDKNGNISGTLIESVDDWLQNPSGVTVTYTIASKSSSITSASLDSDNDISIAATGLTASVFSAFVTARASATIGGQQRQVEQQIDVRLIYALAEKGDTGEQGDTGIGDTGEKGDTGTQGDTGVGDKGDKGDTHKAIKETQAAKAVRVTRETRVVKVARVTKETRVAQGGKGDKGDTGSSGGKGDKGDTGSQGGKGDKGDTGRQGGKGDKGDTGSSRWQG